MSSGRLKPGGGCSLRITVGKRASIHAVMPELQAAFGMFAAVDEHTALFSHVARIPATVVSKVARTVHEVVDCYLTSEGDRVELEDGRIFVAEGGSWRRVENA